jgi:NADPH-dependent 2,4-dienoyl-CoA reductase/sulfur reductase-like enzyme
VNEKGVTQVPAIVTNGSDYSSDRLDAAVIGAGEAGLAMDYFLAQQGRHSIAFMSATGVEKGRRQSSSLM